MIGEYAVKENLTSVDTKKAQRYAIFNHTQEDKAAKVLVEKLDVRPPDTGYSMTGLSGGNQQKVVIGKWLTNPYQLYLMDEVTSGVDIEAKASIYGIIGEIVKAGGAVLLATGDIEEAMGISDRIIVLYKGKIVLTTKSQETTKDTILACIMRGAIGAE